jgi:hypothetical protein
MAVTAIIVSFAIGTSNAVYCSKPMPLDQAQAEVAKFPVGADWVSKFPGLTPPNYIVRGHPNYGDAINGKVVDDPVTGVSTTVPPCKPFP